MVAHRVSNLKISGAMTIRPFTERLLEWTITVSFTTEGFKPPATEGKQSFYLINKCTQNVRPLYATSRKVSGLKRKQISRYTSIQEQYIYIYIYVWSRGRACWPLVPKFAGSNPAEAVGFLGRKNPQHAFLRRGSKAVGLMS